jgi:hypothetical protein
MYLSTGIPEYDGMISDFVQQSAKYIEFLEQGKKRAFPTGVRTQNLHFRKSRERKICISRIFLGGKIILCKNMEKNMVVSLKWKIEVLNYIGTC